MMERVRDIAQLVRWQNLLMIAILMWVLENWVAVPVMQRYYSFGSDMSLPWYVQLVLIVATMLVAAGGYVINDYFDIKIDRINRPDSVIVGERMDKPQAMHLSIGLSAAGVVLGLGMAYLLNSWATALIFMLTPGLLWFYSSSYKRQFIVGNLIVSVMTALVILLVAVAHVAVLRIFLPGTLFNFQHMGMTLDWEKDLYTWFGGFALMAFLYTWMREIVKDMQDEMGDRELECRTMPIKWGFMWSKVFVTVLALLTAAMLVWLHVYVLPFNHAWGSFATRYLLFGLLIPLVCSLWLMWAARIPSDYRNAQLMLKFAMFLGVLYSFVIQQHLCI